MGYPGYFVKVATSNKWFAGSNAKIKITLGSRHIEVGTWELPFKQRKNVTRECSFTSEDKGEITEIKLQSDGSGIFSDWHCHNVVVQYREFTHDTSRPESNIVVRDLIKDKKAHLYPERFYEVVATTGPEQTSGTTMQVSIKFLYGGGAESPEGFMNKSAEFTPNAVCSYRLRKTWFCDPEDEVDKIVLRKRGESNAWQPSKITVRCTEKLSPTEEFNFGPNVKISDAKEHTFSGALPSGHFGIYWCKRKMESFFVGNHHFIMLVFTDKATAESVVTPAIGKGVKGYGVRELPKNFGQAEYYISFGVGRDDNGNIIAVFNYPTDLTALREYADRETYFEKWNLDFNCHGIIKSPPGSAALEDDKDMAIQVLRSAVYFYHTANHEISYNVLDRNCASWVNTLFASRGYSHSYRKRMGQFDGVDWGEHDDIGIEHFSYDEGKAAAVDTESPAADKAKDQARVVAVQDGLLPAATETVGPAGAAV